MSFLKYRQLLISNSLIHGSKGGFYLDHQANPNHKNNAGASLLSFAEKVGNA